MISHKTNNAGRPNPLSKSFPVLLSMTPQKNDISSLNKKGNAIPSVVEGPAEHPRKADSTIFPFTSTASCMIIPPMKKSLTNLPTFLGNVYGI